jgi:hypothetical protein
MKLSAPKIVVEHVFDGLECYALLLNSLAVS